MQRILGLRGSFRVWSPPPNFRQAEFAVFVSGGIWGGGSTENPENSPTVSSTVMLPTTGSFSFIPPFSFDRAFASTSLIFNEANIKDNFGSASLELVYETAAKLLFMSVNWARSIPSFVQLPFRDQAILLEESWCELFILSASQYSLLIDVGQLVSACGFSANNQPERAAACDIQLTKLRDIIERFNSFGLDFTDFACLKAVVLFKSDIKGLRDNLQVESLQDQAQLMLSGYSSLHYPNNKARFGKLLLQLHSLRTISPRLIQDIFFRRAIGSIPIESLLCDIFKSS
ncbi:hypothetical protein CHS0354_008127 [Potamilus streckersoni]|uniref:NR LBD domain-containing protein n=1 Tax=Potamilus streckersoni TaxID=2493646 RepID=A0AAE0SZG9_9BIVA|nr:hypothetical protein CHS0354_008127 [Potamilus streckersoni]